MTRIMKRLFYTLIFIAAGLATVSCVKEQAFGESQSVDSGIPIEFCLPAQTKALLNTDDGQTVSFEDGDVVGIFQYYNHDGETKTTVSSSANNVPYKYEAATGKFIPVDAPATWGGTADATHNLYVYYPYDVNAKGISSNDNKLAHTLPASQAYNDEQCRIIDYGFAWSRQHGAQFGSAVEFEPMTQFFSVFRLNIENNTDQDVIVNSVDLAVTSKGADGNNKYLAGTFDLWLNALKDNNAGFELKGDGRKQKITTTVTNGTVAAGSTIDVRFMVRPSDYTGAEFTVDIVTDKGNYQVIFTGGKINAGARASKNITMVEQSAERTYAIGDVVDGGVLYWISEDKSTGKVLYPYRSGKVMFSTESPIAKLNVSASATDGASNVAILKAIDPTLAKFPAAQYCDELEGNWYLPADEELKLLFEAYNGTSWDAATNKKPESITPEETAARAKFDSYMDSFDPNGDILNKSAAKYQGYEYWSSVWNTTYDKVYGIRFGQKGRNANSVNTGDSYYTRCIKNVSLTGASEPSTPSLPEQETGEYDLYLLIGQSNMAGRGEMIDGDAAAITGAYLLNSANEIEPASNPINRYSSAIATSDNEAFSLGASFARAIYQETGRKVLLVSNARGSTDIEQWDGVVGNEEIGKEDYNLEDYFETTIARVKAAIAKGGKLKAILWHQGCADLTEANTTYMATLQTLVANYRAELGDVPFYAGELGKWRGWQSVKDFNGMIQTIGTNISNTDWVSSEGLKNLASEADQNNGKGGPHFDRASQIVLGERYAEKVLKRVYGIDYTASSMPTE